MGVVQRVCPQIVAGGLAVVVLLATAASEAGAGDGHELLRQCTATVEFNEGNIGDALEFHLDSAKCVGLLNGILVRNTLLLSEVDQTVKGAVFCPGARLTSGIAATCVVSYLEANARQLHEQDRALALAALLQAHPCGAGAVPASP